MERVALMWPRPSCPLSASLIAFSYGSNPDGVLMLALKNRWLTVFTSRRRRPAGVSRSASPYPVMLRIMHHLPGAIK